MLAAAPCVFIIVSFCRWLISVSPSYFLLFFVFSILMKKGKERTNESLVFSFLYLTVDFVRSFLLVVFFFNSV